MMPYDPEKHRRRSIRLKDYDYSQGGAYFVTICAFERECYFEQFPVLKEIVAGQWMALAERFPSAIMADYVIMPNHLHGIIVIDEGNGDPRKGYPQGVSLQKKKPDLGTIVGTFKSLCVNTWLKVIKAENINARGKFWQDNYYEHIIRNEEELARIRTYVAENPIRWELDRENPANQNRPGTNSCAEWMN